MFCTTQPTLMGMPAFGHYPAQYIVDQHLLVAGRVKVAQLRIDRLMSSPASAHSLQRGDSSLYLPLTPNTPRSAPVASHHRLQAGHHLRRVVDHELLIHVGQRLALGPVGDHHSPAPGA
jgi:hypothetical protein